MTDLIDDADNRTLDAIHDGIHISRRFGDLMDIDTLEIEDDPDILNMMVEATLSRIARLSNSGKGKPCGEGFIESGDKCHIGEVKQTVEYGSKTFKTSAVKSAAEWVKKWSWEKDTDEMPSKSAEEVLKYFRPSKPENLYRFEREDHDESKVESKLPIQSWSHNEEMVKSIVDDMNASAKPGQPKMVVRSKSFMPQEVFTDFTKFNDKFKKEIEKFGGDSDMQEVLVWKPKSGSKSKPDSYTYHQQEVDKKVSQYIQKRVEGLYDMSKGGAIPAHDGVKEAIKVLDNLKDASGWRGRTQIYDTDEENAPILAKVIAGEKWPTTGPMGALANDLQAGYPHAFMMVGKYVYDPVLTSQNVKYEDVKKFGRRLTEAFYKAGIKPTPLDAKPKASTSDILGTGHNLGKNDSEFWDEVGPIHTYSPPGKWQSAGAVVFNDKGEVSVRKVAGGYGGYAFSFGKGMIDKGETDEQAAHREVLEEQGHKGEIVGDLGKHEGTSSVTHFYLMKHTGDDPSKMDKETDSVSWLSPSDAAEKLDSVRDLRVLVRAMTEIQKYKNKT